MNLPQLPLDKAMHVIYGLVAGLLGAVIAGQIGVMPAIGAAALGALVGAAKEVADKVLKLGEPSVGDFVATAAGGAAIALATLL